MSGTIGTVPYVEGTDKISAYPALSKTIAERINSSITAATKAQSEASSAARVAGHAALRVKNLEPVDSQGVFGAAFDLDSVTEPGERFGGVAKSAKLATQVAMWTLRTYRGHDFTIQVLDGIPYSGTGQSSGRPKRWHRFVVASTGIAAATWQEFV
ncbi:hypothetical protein [Brevibacterium otitidis]|uniref:HK97 gp10 family phage protein n=1 Tax=Brevibacterium otitidis TaxID=53364 RepID=A0ABV5WYW5_9MICO|nr:hypothetical protein GCM10023233_25860 [Brevibacterium otitidis]